MSLTLKNNNTMGYIHPQSTFRNAQTAFVMLYNAILENGMEVGNGTKSMHNIGFYLERPLERDINVDWRKWSEKYAEREWEWYASENRSVKEIKKYAPIWDKMHGGDDLVNSNYGYQWSRNDQLAHAISLLRRDVNSRQAWVTIHDGKEWNLHLHDTPCTLSIGFRNISGHLCMTVLMRSNDLWYGFCNDQYCFSKLQEYAAKVLGLKVGWYYHYAGDLHLYEKHYTSKDDFYERLKATNG